jgi:hypothetical protein
VSDDGVFTVAPVQMDALSPGTFGLVEEAYIHALVGAPFGDLELDVGKSVRWTQWFADDVFITDINTGDPRYWIVNWELTFPQAHHHVTDINYFVDPVAFRKEQFAAAQREPGILLEDNDWVLFVDAAEGMSCDTRSLPDNYEVQPFRSFVYREITRATTAGKDFVSIPFFAFLRHDDIITVDYQTEATAGLGEGLDSVQQSLGTPYYLANQGLARLWKVGALKALGFDWTKLDQPQPASADVKLQIVSYAYAHWNLQDIEPPDTEVPPLSQYNDDGWRMRKLISRVRPIASLPYQDPWKDPSQDPVGLRGPWAGQFTDSPEVGQLDPATFDATNGDFLTSPNIDLRITDNTTWTMAVVPTDASSGTLLSWSALDDDTPVLYWEIATDAGHLTFSYLNPDEDLVDVDLGPVPVTNGQLSYVGVDVAKTPTGYEVVGITSDNGQNWFEVGTPQAIEPMLVTPREGELNLVFDFDGLLHWAEQAVSDTEVWHFSAADYRYDFTPPPTSWTDPRGRFWVVHNDPARFSASNIIPLSVPPPDAAVAGVLVPLYDTVFRINLRDGVWYDTGQLGNVPMIWDNETGKWVPVVLPEDWHETPTYVAPIA